MQKAYYKKYIVYIIKFNKDTCVIQFPNNKEIRTVPINEVHPIT